MLRSEQKEFSDFVSARNDTAYQIALRIRPKTLTDLKDSVRKIMDGEVSYYVNDAIDKRYGTQCTCSVDNFIIFFNEHPVGTLQLVDAEYQP